MKKKNDDEKAVNKTKSEIEDLKNFFEGKKYDKELLAKCLKAFKKPDINEINKELDILSKLLKIKEEKYNEKKEDLVKYLLLLIEKPIKKEINKEEKKDEKELKEGSKKIDKEKQILDEEIIKLFFNIIIQECNYLKGIAQKNDNTFISANELLDLENCAEFFIGFGNLDDLKLNENISKTEYENILTYINFLSLIIGSLLINLLLIIVEFKNLNLP